MNELEPERRTWMDDGLRKSRALLPSGISAVDAEQPSTIQTFIHFLVNRHLWQALLLNFLRTSSVELFLGLFNCFTILRRKVIIGGSDRTLNVLSLFHHLQHLFDSHMKIIR